MSVTLIERPESPVDCPRAARIEEIRALIDADAYDTPERIAGLVNRLAEELPVGG